MDDFVSETFRETLRFALDPLYGDSDLQAMANFPFLDYASNYWAAHLKSLGSDDFTTIWPLFKAFVDSKEEGSFESWIMISQYNHGVYKFPLGAKAVHVAALYGLEVMLAGLLNADRSSSMKQTSDGRTPLHIALENEQEGAADLLLEATEKGGLITRDLLGIRDQIGRTPLHIAIESGSEVAVVKLVTAGADVNAIQPDGRTAISVAVENRWDLLADFLSQMADPSKILPDGRSLLHIAAESGSLAWVRALLQFHEDKLIDTRDGNGWTPLHYAVDREHPDIAQALIDRECLIEAFDKNGWTPLHAAVRRRNLPCAELLLSKAWPGGKPGRTDLSAQPSSSRVSPPDDPLSDSGTDHNPLDFPSTISQRLEVGGRSSRTTQEPRPRPSLSGKYGDEALRYRPESSPDRSPSLPPLPRRLALTVPQLSQPSPLHLAVSESYVECVKLLIKHLDKLSRLGSSVTEEMRCLKTAIDMAKDSGNTDIVLILIRNFPKSRLEEVFLSLAALPSDAVREHLKTVFTSSDIYGTYIPAAAHMESLIPTLINTWPDVDVTVVHNAILGRLGMAKIFIENGVSTWKVLMEESPDSLLHRCIRGFNADFELAMYLIERGAEVNKRNADGESPLLIVSGLQTTSSDLKRQQACLKVAQLLVAKGADIHVLDERQRGLCHRAAAGGNVQTLKLNPSSRDKNSRTPLLLAVENGRTNSVRLLLRQLLSVEEGSKIDPYEQTAGAMEYANMRAAPLLRAMVERSTRNFFIVTALVEADEQAFRNLSPERQLDLSDLRTSFYLEALTWSIDCDFFSAFTLLLPKIPKTTLASRPNLDGDGVFHVVAAAKHTDFLKTLLQTLDNGNLNDCRAMRLANPVGKMPMDIVIESGSLEKFILMRLHHVELTRDQITKARGKGFNVPERMVG
jgi:ankyrin repeat protein